MKDKQYRLRHAAGADWIIKANQREEAYIPPVMVNECGALVFKGLEAGADMGKIAGILQEQYGISADEALEDVRLFVEQLEGIGIKVNEIG